MKSAQQIIDASISEKDFQAQVVQFARLTGWLVYHTFESRQVTSKGFPDLVLCKSSRNGEQGKTIFAELKTERGKLRPEQEVWLAALRASGVDARLWKPSMWENEIVPTLRA